MDLEATAGPYEYYGYDYDEAENATMCDYSEWTPSYSVIPVLYMLIFILGLFGNGLVVFTVWRAQGRRRAADVFIGNLALADLSFVVTLPLWAVYIALDHWPFGLVLCKISNYLFMLNMFASVFFLTCMSFDRYLAIVNSLSTTQLHIRAHVRSALKVIWLLSGLLAVPELVFYTTHQYDLTSETTCYMDFSLVASSLEEHLRWKAGLRITAAVLGFLLPFLAMMVCYCFIGCTATRHFNTRRNEDQKKRRPLKIITSVVVVFAVCWTPYHFLNIASALLLGSGSLSFEQFLSLAHPYAIGLAYINSCLNPVLYAFLDPHFRSQCLRLLKCKKSLQTSPAAE